MFAIFFLFTTFLSYRAYHDYRLRGAFTPNRVGKYAWIVRQRRKFDCDAPYYLNDTGGWPKEPDHVDKGKIKKVYP